MGKYYVVLQTPQSHCDWRVIEVFRSEKDAQEFIAECEKRDAGNVWSKVGWVYSIADVHLEQLLTRYSNQY